MVPIVLKYETVRFKLKCKEMRVSFLHQNSCELQLIATGGTYIEEVKSFKLLGVSISNDFSWAAQCEGVVKKANRRLYAIRQLRKCGVPQGDLVSIYYSLSCALIWSTPVLFSPTLLNICHKIWRRFRGVLQRLYSLLFLTR